MIWPYCQSQNLIGSECLKNHIMAEVNTKMHVVAIVTQNRLMLKSIFALILDRL